MKNFLSSNPFFQTLAKIFVLGFFVTGSVFAQGINVPSDVDNLTAEAQDKAVNLVWSPATDDGIIYQYKIYYGTSQVLEPDDSYDAHIVVDGELTEYLVGNLLNDVQYYFAVTAVDDQGQESDNYSPEASATPTLGGSSSGNPEVLSAQHKAPNEILVTMSESVQVDSSTDSFLVVHASDDEQIGISNTIVNSEKVIILLSEDLIVGDQYFITATSGVEDMDGNPVSSGITDTIDLFALDEFPVDEPEPVVTPPTEEEPLIPEESVIETPEDNLPPAVIPNDEEEFDFLDTFLEDPENANINNDTSLEDLELEGEQPSENLEAEDNSQSSAPDNQPPQDARNLQVDTSTAQSEGSVMVSWTPAVDIDDDIADQVLYTRVGLGEWDGGYSLGKDVTSTEIDVAQNQNYQVRIVTIDRSGNESMGTEFTFSTNLVQSGNGGMIWIMGGALLFGMLLLFGRRQSA